MKLLSVLCLAAPLAGALPLSGVMAQEARREVAPHVHGEGKLAVAIEGGTVSMELEAPAKDIIGFEHAPKTAKEKKLVADAKARFTDGGKLFALPSQAQCKQTSVATELHGLAGPKAGKGHSHGKHTHAKADAGGGAQHAEFRVTYVFACNTPAALKTLDLAYFAAFKGAEKLEVSLIGPKGQASMEASREKPSVDLAGVN